MNHENTPRAAVVTVAGIEAGQRNTVSRAILTVANHVAALAMEGASDHRDGYQRAKVALSALAGFLIPQAKGPTHGR